MPQLFVLRSPQSVLGAGVLACIACLLSDFALAGAWTLPVGKSQAIVTLSGYRSTRLHDNNGDSRAQPTYEQLEQNIYVQHGLRDWLTLGGSLYLDAVRQEQPAGGSDGNMGVADSEWFAVARVHQQGAWVASLRPFVRLPRLLTAEDTPAIGSSHVDLGLEILNGWGFDAWGQHHYIDTALGYRYRDGSARDQLTFQATAGLRVLPRVTLLPQLFLTYRTGNFSTPSFTQSPRDDYNLIKLQGSALYHWDERTAFQFGVFDHVDGRNTGTGSGVILGVWRNF